MVLEAEVWLDLLARHQRGRAMFSGLAHRPHRLTIPRGLEVLAIRPAPGRVPAGDVTVDYEARLPAALGGLFYCQLSPWLEGCRGSARLRLHLPPGARAVVSAESGGELEWTVARAGRLSAVVAPRMGCLKEGAVRVFHRPGEEQWARQIARAGAEALGFYHNLLGRSPYAALNLVSGDPARQGGCSLGPALSAVHTAVPEGELPEPYWRWIVAHEMGHQYFGERVTDPDRPAWVWLGAGLYLDHLFAESRGLSVRAHGHFLDCYLRAQAAGLSTALGAWPARATSEPGLNFHHAVLHGKSLALFLALDHRVGREAMLDALRRALNLPALGRRELEELLPGQGEFFQAWVDTGSPLSELPGGRRVQKMTHIIPPVRGGDL